MTPTPADRRRPPAGRKPGPPGPPGRNDTGPTPRHRPSILHVALGVAVLLVVVNFGYSVLQAPAPPAPAPVVVASAPAPPPVVEEAAPEPEPVLLSSTYDANRGPEGRVVMD